MEGGIWRMPLSSTFALFWRPFVTSWPKQDGATLMELGVQTTSQVPSHGGSDGQYSQEGSAAEVPFQTPTQERTSSASAFQEKSSARAAPGATSRTHRANRWRALCVFRRRLHATELATLRGAAVRGHLDHGQSHHQQLAAHCGSARAGRSVQLSPRHEQALLVHLAVEPSAGEFHLRALAAAGNDSTGRRRHGGRTQGQEGFRKRLSSRCGSFDALVHRISLGTQVGRAGGAGEVPVRNSALGVADLVRAVPHREGQRGVRPAAQNACGIDAADVGGAVALVSRAAFCFHRRWRLRHASVGMVRASASPTVGVGESLLSRRQLVCLAGAAQKQEGRWASAQERPQAAQAGSGGETRRWNIETTFQEMRTWLKVEKTRGWTEKTVLRTAPCLFGLYALIAVIYAELPGRWQAERVIVGAQKTCVTFSDAITAVRRWLWAEWIFATPGHSGAFTKIPPRLRAALLTSLAPSA